MIFLTRCIKSALTLSILTCINPAEAASESTTSTVVKSVREIGENLGVQIRKTQMMRGDFGKWPDGRDVMYTVVMGAPAVFAAVDVKSGDLLTTRSMPGTSGAWAVHVSTDNSVYLGAYNQGLMFRFVPGSGELKNLGYPFDSRDAVIYPMDSTHAGKAYGGTYPSGHLYEFDPGAGKFTDLGQVTDNPNSERWIRVTTYDPETHKLYLGTGNMPQLIEYDIATGDRRDLLPAEYSNITAVYDLSVVGDLLFARKESNNPYEYFVLNKQTGEQVEVTNGETGEKGLTFLAHSRGVSAKSPVANKVYFSGPGFLLSEYDLDTHTYRSLGHKLQGGSALGFGYVQLDDPDMPGYSLVGIAGHRGNIFKYNLETDTLKIMEVELPSEPVLIHSIHTGPDGKIYTGGYLSGNAGVFDPGTGEHRVLQGISQSEGMATVDEKLYFGAYPNAKIYEYDPAQEWNLGVTPPNPKLIFTLEHNDEIPGYTGQDRPFAMTGADDLDKLIVGTVPKNGMHGGTLAVYDTATSGSQSEVYWNLLPDQSITAVAYHDGLAYVGGSIHGGQGASPKAKEASLMVWDVEKKEKVFETVPAPGSGAITALHVAPDGNIWGWAYGTLFIFDPQKREVVYSKEEFPQARGRWLDGSFVTGEDGNIYATINGHFVKIDATTRQVTVIAKDAVKVARDSNGRFYTWQHGTPYLYRLTVD